jgi:hypothetical protein
MRLTVPNKLKIDKNTNIDSADFLRNLGATIICYDTSNNTYDISMDKRKFSVTALSDYYIVKAINGSSGFKFYKTTINSSTKDNYLIQIA